MNKMLTTLIFIINSELKIAKKYDWPRFESEWCALFMLSNSLYAVVTHSFFLLLLWLKPFRRTKILSISQAMLISLFFLPWPIPPPPSIDVTCYIYRFIARIHDSTWHRIHVTNKRFGLLFWHPSCTCAYIL